MITFLEEIEIGKTGLLSALVADYVSQSENLKQLYKYPFSLNGFAQVIKDKALDNTDRKLLVDVLTGQYRDIPTSDKVHSNIALLGDEKTFTVTASHQPGLLLGPLFNIYKIAGAIHLASTLITQYPDFNFVPVFWMGSEDHDIEELNNTYINGKRIEWKEAGSGAVGRLKTNTLQALLPQMKELGVSDEMIAKIQIGLQQYQTFGRFTQYLVDDIFKEHGLVVLDQDSAGLKDKFKPIILDEILNQRATPLLQANIDFLDTNYKAQAKPREINFFYLGEGYRERLLYDSTNGLYTVNNTTLGFTKEEITAEVNAHPERFSPNVIFRPLYQEFTLPNLAFIGGAGELSYWLELKPLFEYYKINYPMQVMRPMAAIVSNGLLKKLEKLNLKAVDFLGDVEQLINRYVKSNLADETPLDDEKNKIATIFDAIAEKATLADATLKQNVAAERQKTLAVVDNITAKIFKAEKRKQETAINQIRSVHAELFPEGVLQERHENFIPFYDAEFIQQVVANADVFKEALNVFVNG